jgi:hypothetical protein
MRSTNAYHEKALSVIVSLTRKGTDNTFGVEAISSPCRRWMAWYVHDMTAEKFPHILAHGSTMNCNSSSDADRVLSLL